MALWRYVRGPLNLNAKAQNKSDTMINTQSLGVTLDNLNEAFFEGWTLTRPVREQAAKWIASRQGLPGSYAGMFAPTEQDSRQGITFFTGEKLKTRAGSAHILGEEACRALILLKVSDVEVREALKRASDGMAGRMRLDEGRTDGYYCCGKCSVSLWRHLAVGGLTRSEQLLAAGMKTLKAHRDGSGRWRVFPFHYTLLALTEIALPGMLPGAGARSEMRYAAPVCERLLKRSSKANVYDRRHRMLAERVLAQC